MEKPVKPFPSDCCGQGCTPCVYEQYAQRMKMYKQWIEEQKEKKEEKNASELKKNDLPHNTD